ncbi:hypothetical protein [Methylocystis hirsuta]|uniref:hypothetical protein n=1 Tax=Methylocystis hirsuta TaxID=369798 RepID=UPI0011CD4A00|nr:hypothetical protein [Methylocystis hirsuta]
MEAQLKGAASQLLEEGFRSADYLGRGRYAAVLERSRAKGESSYFPSHEMKVFSIRPQPDGAILIGGSRPGATAPCQLVGTDAEIDGRLTVTLGKGIKVLGHNAQIKLSNLDHFGGRQWRIRSPDSYPFMIVQAMK